MAERSLRQRATDKIRENLQPVITGAAILSALLPAFERVDNADAASFANPVSQENHVTNLLTVTPNGGTYTEGLNAMVSTESTGVVKTSKEVVDAIEAVAPHLDTQILWLFKSGAWSFYSPDPNLANVNTLKEVPPVASFFAIMVPGELVTTPEATKTPQELDRILAQQVATEINNYLISVNGRSLPIDSTLTSYAQACADYLASTFQLDHVCQNNPEISKILTQNWRGGAVYENLALPASRNPLLVINGWKNSPGHNATMVNPNNKSFAVGCSTRGDGKTVCVAEFGQ